MSVRQGYYGLVRQNGPWTPTKKDWQHINAPAPSDPSHSFYIRPAPYTPTKPSSNPSKYVQRKIIEEPYKITSRGVKLPLGTLKRPLPVNVPPMQPVDYSEPAGLTGPGQVLGESPGGPPPNFQRGLVGGAGPEGEPSNVEVKPEGVPPGGYPEVTYPQIEDVVTRNPIATETSFERQVSRYDMGTAFRQVATAASTVAGGAMQAYTVYDYAMQTFLTTLLPKVGQVMNARQIGLDVALTLFLGPNAQYLIAPLRRYRNIEQWVVDSITHTVSDYVAIPLAESARQMMLAPTTTTIVDMPTGTIPESPAMRAGGRSRYRIIAEDLWNNAYEAGEAAMLTGMFNQASRYLGQTVSEGLNIPDPVMTDVQNAPASLSILRIIYNALAAQGAGIMGSGIEYVRGAGEAAAQQAINMIPGAVAGVVGGRLIERGRRIGRGPGRHSGHMSLRDINVPTYYR